MSAVDTDPDMAMARRMVQTAVWMKRQYQDAGLVVARVFCDAKGFDIDQIEHSVRQEMDR